MSKVKATILIDLPIFISSLGKRVFIKNCVKTVPKGPDLALHKSRRNTHGFLSFFEIHLLFNSNFQSWQMHSLPTLDPLCIFKLLSGWKSMIRLAAIDCAQDENVATCRNYDIMGYPTLKFFPPKAATKDIGEARETMSKEIPLMMSDMADFVEKVSKNASFSSFWQDNHWPTLEPLTT